VAIVLVVDDDPELRDLLSLTLRLDGHSVSTAVHGGDALAQLPVVRPSVILLDLMMPVMDGWQFRQAQVKNENLAKIPVIVVSAAGRERIERIDADAYLSKPVDLEELLGCVTQFCHPDDRPA
jgi:CheY-like chemotaxis protein